VESRPFNLNDSDLDDIQLLQGGKKNLRKKEKKKQKGSFVFFFCFFVVGRV
jgi:hypothetical protein